MVQDSPLFQHILATSLEPRNSGAIHGYVLTAWAVAGMVGPVLLSVTHELLHTYTVTIIAFIIIDVIALFFSYHIRKDFVREIRNLKQEA